MPIILEVTDQITDKIEQTAALQRQHWEEVARNKEVMVLNPDVAQYQRLQDLGMLFGIFAYDGDEIVGYSVNVLAVNMHYSELLIAQNDILYLAPAHRGGRLGIHMMKKTEEYAALRGARMMIWHAKEGTPLNNILPRMGYGVQDVLFSKQLG